MKELLQSLVDKFNSTKNEKVKNKLKGLVRTITVVFEDDGSYHLKLENSQLSKVEVGYVKGDIEIITTTEIFQKIINKQLDALTAYITKKIRIKASLMDKILLNDILK